MDKLEINFALRALRVMDLVLRKKTKAEKTSGDRDTRRRLINAFWNPLVCKKPLWNQFRRETPDDAELMPSEPH